MHKTNQNKKLNDLKIKQSPYNNQKNMNNFNHLKTFKIKKKDPNIDLSIRSMNITQLKKFAAEKGIKNLKNLTRENLINIIEWPTLDGDLTVVESEIQLTEAQKIETINKNLNNLKDKFIIIVKENSQLKQLLGEYKYKNDSRYRKNHVLEIIFLVIIIALIISLVTVILI